MLLQVIGVVGRRGFGLRDQLVGALSFVNSVGMTVGLPLVSESPFHSSICCPGHQDSVLSENGRQQARRLAARLAREAFTAIYSSDLLRASEVGKEKRLAVV